MHRTTEEYDTISVTTNNVKNIEKLSDPENSCWRHRLLIKINENVDYNSCSNTLHVLF